MEKIRIKLKGFDHKLVDKSVLEIVAAAKSTGAKISGPIPLPTRLEKVTVLRSVCVNKKAREQFEIRNHRRLIDIMNTNSDTVDALMKLQLPAGVSVNIKN